jgi:hypothetical protein
LAPAGVLGLIVLAVVINTVKIGVVPGIGDRPRLHAGRARGQTHGGGRVGADVDLADPKDVREPRQDRVSARRLAEHADGDPVVLEVHVDVARLDLRHPVEDVVHLAELDGLGAGGGFPIRVGRAPHREQHPRSGHGPGVGGALGLAARVEEHAHVDGQRDGRHERGERQGDQDDGGAPLTGASVLALHPSLLVPRVPRTT